MGRWTRSVRQVAIPQRLIMERSRYLVQVLAVAALMLIAFLLVV